MVLIRDEAANQKVQEEYINFLRGMFKGTEPTKYIQLAYLTGILPIKREKTQSALNNFDEFTMLSPSILAKYIGFTEDEVQKLAEEYHQNFEEVKRWYDGYLLKDYQVYNPRAVISLMQKGEFKSYWSETASYEAIVPLINMDYDGLKTAIIEMLSGAAVKVNTATFKNDILNIQSKDDVLTYMIHLGYLGYDQTRKMAFVPNEDIRQELEIALDSKIMNKWKSHWQKIYSMPVGLCLFHPQSVPSVIFHQDFFFSGSGDFCIDLSGDNTAVSQQFLDIPDSGAIV